MSQQETATDRLVTVIQSLQLGRATGVLTTRRGEGATQEEGSIAFVNGQVAEASAGRRSGSGAFNWLSTWGRCLFSFVPSDTSPFTPPYIPPSPGALEDQHKDNGLNPRIQASTSDKQSGPLERQSGPLITGGPPDSAAGQPTQSARTSADFVHERFDSRTLALLVALTGILATMPYIALQMFGIEIAFAQMGIPIEISLFIAFVIVAA